MSSASTALLAHKPQFWGATQCGDDRVRGSPPQSSLSGPGWIAAAKLTGQENPSLHPCGPAGVMEYCVSSKHSQRW